MKRRVLMLALFLVLGAIVNVAVAWGCLLLVDFKRVGQSAGGFADSDPNSWHFTVRSALGSTLVSRDASDDRTRSLVLKTFPHWSAVARQPTSLERSSDTWQFEDARGLPMRAMLAGHTMPKDWGQRANGCEVKWGIPVPQFGLVGVVRRALPLRPIWPGFAINTVFYAAVLWLLFAAPFALRKRRRIKRGLCPKCAYPVGTNAVCTECGAAVVKPKAARQKAEIA